MKRRRSFCVVLVTTCSKCRLWRPAAYFDRNASRPDGFQAHCKFCRSAYRVAHRDRQRAYDRAYYLKNKDRKREYRLRKKERVA